MLYLYDLNHNKIKGLKEYKDYHIKSVLSTGDKTLYFSYPSKFSDGIYEECYIRNKTDEFVIKKITDTGNNWINVTAVLNVEDLEGKAWKTFESIEQTIESCLNLAFAGTGWTIGSSSIVKKRTIKKTNSNSWDILQQAIKTYRCEIKLDSINKTVTIKDKIGEDKGVYFTDSLNVVSLNTDSNTNEFYTKMIALGKTTKTTAEDGTETESTLEVVVENYQYSDKVKTIIWKDERYTDEASLLEDAAYKLDEISKPYMSYSVQVYDLANMNPIYKDILSYDIGDTITLISNSRHFKDKQRIVSIDKYPDEPERNSCELGNVNKTFEQVQKEQEEVNNTVNNITSDDGTISPSAIKGVLGSISVGEINVQELNAIKIRVGKLEASVATINEAYIDKAYIDTLIADYAKINDLEAATAKIGILEADYATIQELLSGHITSGNIQVGSITGDSLNMDTIFVRDANILDLSAGKITSGSLDTTKVTIQSKNGNIIIADATQQFKDNSGNVRLQLGQDVNGDFNFILYDDSGNGVLIDSTGIKESAIEDGLIKNEMIGDGEVGGEKINWQTFVESFNSDTNAHAILSSKILVDGKNQTLNVHLNKLQEEINTLSGLEGDVSGLLEIVSSHTTQLNMQQGQIDTLIQDTTITKDGETTTLKDEFNKMVDTVDSHTQTIASHESQLNTIDNSIKSVESKTNTLEQTLDSTVSTVSQHSTKVTELETTVNTHTSQISQMNNEISLRVTEQHFNEVVNPLSTELQNLKTSVDNDIKDVNDRIDGIVDNVGGAVADGIIEEAETIVIKNSIDALNREKADIDARYTSIYNNTNLKGTPKTNLNSKYTTYNTAHTSLIDSINSMIEDKTATESEKVIYNTKLNEYSTALSQLSEAFDSAINNISLNNAIAKDEELKTSLQKNIDDVSNIANATKEAIGDYTADGILDEAEKNSIKTYLNNLSTEKSDIDKEYSVLYNDSSLTGITKTELKSAYDDYILAYNDLVSKINVILNAAEITDTMRTNMNNAFSTHDSKLSIYSQKANESILAITEKKKQDAITSSQEYYNTQIVIDKQNIMANVSSTYETKENVESKVNNAINQANSDTDNKLKQYSTTVQMESAINLAKDNITSSVSETYITKGDATNSFASKSSLTQTSSEIVANFSSSGGMNLVKDGQFKSWEFNTGKWEYNEDAFRIYGRGSNDPEGTSIGFYSATDGKVDLYQYVKFKPDTTYTFRADIYKEPNIWWYSVVIDFHDGSGKYLGSHTCTEAGNTFTTPSNCYKGALFIRHGGTSNFNGNYVLYVNNVAIYEGTMELPYSPHPEEIYEGETKIDANGVTVTNGAFTLYDKNGNKVFYADDNGNLIFTGNLNPSSQTVNLFGNDCRIDGTANAIRMQLNPNTYMSIDRQGYMRIFNQYSNNGTNYISIGYGSDNHATFFNKTSMIKLLGGSTAQIQCRNTGDNAYISIASSDFINASSKEYKTNIQDIDLEKFKRILSENNVKEYNLKTDVENIIGFFELEGTTVDDIENSSADKKVGLILEDLTDEAKEMLKPESSDGIDLYSMVSMLWGIVQEQQNKINDLELKIQQILDNK